MNRKSIVAIGIFGLACGALGMQACSSSSSGGNGSDDGGSDSGADQTASSSGSSSGSSSSGSGSGSSSGTSSGGSSGSSGSSSGSNDGGADATTCTPVDAGAIDPNLADAGMQLVLQFKCYSCHQSNALDAGGLTLSGRLTSLSDAGPIFPPNLTPDPGTGLGCWTNQQIERALLDGIDDQDASLCVMPKFRSKFLEAGVDIDGSANDIAEFLRSLPAVNHQVPDTTCPSGSPSSDAGEGGTTSDAGDGGTTSDASDSGSSNDAGDASDGAGE